VEKSTAFAWRIVRSPSRLFGVIAAGVLKAIAAPALSDLLPPQFSTAARSGATDAELSPTLRGEWLLWDVWRVSSTYRDAMALVAKMAAETPPELYLHTRVHFVLSRLRPDDSGSVLLARLRSAPSRAIWRRGVGLRHLGDIAPREGMDFLGRARSERDMASPDASL
jgi:hypothetical protein